MVAAYGAYSASATGGNGFCRDFLAGIAALYAPPFYHNIMTGTMWQLTIPSLVLSGIAALVAVPVYIFYYRGEHFRMKSPFAQSIAKQRGEARGERKEVQSQTASDEPLSAENSLEMIEQA